MSNVIVKGKRGRKPKNISFRFEKNRAFTVLDVFNRYARNPKTRVSKVAISVRLNKMVNARPPEAKIVGKKPAEGRGRPYQLFKLV